MRKAAGLSSAGGRVGSSVAEWFRQMGSTIVAQFLTHETKMAAGATGVGITVSVDVTARSRGWEAERATGGDSRLRDVAAVEGRGEG